jgi:hypothetical protein
MVAHLCLVQRISEDERITSCRSQNGLLDCDGKRTVRVWDVCDNSLSSSQDGRVRVVHSNDETLVRLYHYKEKKGGGNHEQELVSCCEGALSLQVHTRYSGIGRLGSSYGYELAKGECRETLTPPNIGTTRTRNSNCATAVPTRVLRSARRGKNIIFVKERQERGRRKTRLLQKVRTLTATTEARSAATPDTTTCIVLAVQDWPHFNGSKNH